MSLTLSRAALGMRLFIAENGGPVITAGNKVIGVAVTGAERMEESQETENHGIIPIDALAFLKREHS